MKTLKYKIKSLYGNKLVNCLIGLYNPEKYGKKTYLDYNLTKLKGFCRFLIISEDRDYGAGGSICPLFFDGAVSTFAELPLPTDTQELEKIYQYINRINSTRNISLFTLNKQFISSLGGKKIKNYLCSLFHKKVLKLKYGSNCSNFRAIW